MGATTNDWLIMTVLLFDFDLSIDKMVGAIISISNGLSSTMCSLLCLKQQMIMYWLMNFGCTCKKCHQKLHLYGILLVS